MNGIDIVRKWYNALKFPEKYDREFNELIKNAPIPQNNDINEYEFSPTLDDGGKNLIACLYFCEQLEKRYEKLGIPKEILFDTLRDFVVLTDTYYSLTGKLGVIEHDWIKKPLVLNLFRLGRLQFCFEGCREDIKEIGALAGDIVLATHVPKGLPLDKTECLRSLERAKIFFKTYFPEKEYKCFTCASWLLGNNLIDFVKEDSNLINFQRIFTLVSQKEDYSILKFCVAWNATKENLARFTPKNRFTERIINHVLSGGKFYKGFGYIK